MKLNQLASISLVIGLLATVADPRQSKKAPLREQVSFGLEQAVDRPVPVPDEVLIILKTDPDVITSGCLDRSQLSGKTSLFEASQVHLSGPEEVGLLVKAKNACLFGANIGPFWIFRKTSQRYELLLSVSALGIEILPGKTNGFRDVSAGAMAGGKVVYVLYKFDGHKYNESGSKVGE